MRPFYTMLLALAIVVLCSDVVTKVVTANGGGATTTVTPWTARCSRPSPAYAILTSAWSTARPASAAARWASAFPTDAGARTAVSHLVVVGTERRAGIRCCMLLFPDE
ncbi:hypothetical protein ACQJBY_071782 [Aegilops geniculata]